jgi:hypothetical protein
MNMPKWSRDYLLTVVLAGVAAVLGLAVVVEWAVLERSSRKILAAAPVKSVPGEAADATAVQDFELPDLDEFAATVERPLFAENRRPPAEDADAAAAPAPSKPLTLKLMGVVFTPKQHTALLVDAKGKYKRIRKDESLDGWTLVALAPGKVTMQQGEEQKELMLLKPKPKVPSVPNAPPQPGQPHPKVPAQPPNDDQADEQDEADEEAEEPEDMVDEEIPDEDTGESGE